MGGGAVSTTSYGIAVTPKAEPDALALRDMITQEFIMVIRHFLDIQGFQFVSRDSKTLCRKRDKSPSLSRKRSSACFSI